MKEYKVRELQRALTRAGFRAIRTKGSHQIWAKGERVVVLPVVTLVPEIALKIIRENNLEL